MRYRNTKTGFILETTNKCSGEFWEAIEPPEAASKDEKKPKRKAVAKNGKSCNAE